MLNFRKLKHDFPPATLRDGKGLFDKEMIVSTKIIHLKPNTVRFNCCVKGGFDHCYSSELEIDRQESIILDSDCDCTCKCDCQHLAAVLFHLEINFNQLLVAYSKETDVIEKDVKNVNDQERKKLLKTFKEAESKEHLRIDQEMQKQLLAEYVNASNLLGQSPFFQSDETVIHDPAELSVIFTPPLGDQPVIEVQLALRFPYRSKFLSISQIKPFLESIRYNEPVYIMGKRYFFSMSSFDETSQQILKLMVDFAKIPEPKNDKVQRSALIDKEVFGTLLAIAQTQAEARKSLGIINPEEDTMTLSSIYFNSLEEPLRLSLVPAGIQFDLDYLEVPMPKILLKPKISLSGTVISCEEALLFECAKPGMIYQKTYYFFEPSIKRKHLRGLAEIRDMTIPEPLFGTFVENSLPELMRFAHIANKEMIDRFVTLPFVQEVGAECTIHYLNGELEASLEFLYGEIKVPADSSQLTVKQVSSFVTKEGILARNLIEEQNIIENLFQDFIFNPLTGLFSSKNEKKIVEFMTEIVPANQERIKFNCPENLLDQFIYDNSTFKITLSESNRVDMYEVALEVEGYLQGITVDLLWDCISSKRSFIELAGPKKQEKRKGKGEESKGSHKILVLDLERLAPVVQVLDELGIKRLDNHKELRPLWTLANIEVQEFEDICVDLIVSPQLLQVKKQITGEVPHQAEEIPSVIQATFRSYQIEGIQWLDRLRSMYLNGILADDMGLGKTLQAITTLSQFHIKNPGARSIVVCPTSIVYNWKEEFTKFNPTLKILAVDGNPIHRKKLQNGIDEYDVIITSYTLLQKDVEFYKSIPFGYVILDEAQHIKNRGTRNAQSVKMMQGAHRLILTGTPIENSLDELWSLFDFLMPGLLSTYDRFVEKYVRQPTTAPQGKKNLEGLRKKVAPFILRRMKKDVLADLPPVSEVVYHCHLSEVQQALYSAYAASAREELSKLVKKEGFDRVQIHVLATLTRLKQICCHPAIFAKDEAEPGDSAKYDLLFELLENLIEGKHKTVIFSQYTRMLNIMRQDLQKRGIAFEYLDGSSKNRLSIVKKFNEDENVSIFLVSLKAGGTGLNLVGADTVIHYDMWWNPAVKNQATDRVHRMGQQRSVLSYEFVTLNTIEEKILELHKRKKSLVKEVISRDDEILTKLTWEEVLELLQT